MKIGNFGSFDETLKEKGIVGLQNASKLDEQIWNEFCGKWDELAYLSEELIAKLQGKKTEDVVSTENLPLGSERITAVKQRVNQSFFRTAVLTSYNSACCITGINNPELLGLKKISPDDVVLRPSLLIK